MKKQIILLLTLCGVCSLARAQSGPTYSGDTAYLSYLATHPKYFIVNGDSVKVPIPIGSTFLCSTNGITYSWQGSWIPQLSGVGTIVAGSGISVTSVLTTDTVALNLASANTWTARQTFTGLKVTSGTVLDSTGSAGTAAQVWTSNGAGKSPTWQAAAGGGGGNPYYPLIYWGQDNSFFTSPGITDTAGTFTLVANRQYFIPFFVGENKSVDLLIINITSAIASDSFNIGIYNDTLLATTSSHQANALIKDSGAKLGTTTGDKFNSIAATALTANKLYWLSILSNKGITILGYSRQKGGYQGIGFSSTTGGAAMGWYAAQTYASSLPATANFAVGAIQGSSPIVWVTFQ